MPRKKQPEAEVVNLAGQLHSLVSQIMNHHSASSGAAPQDAVLCKVLQVPPGVENRPVLLDRIAQLQRLPDDLRSALLDEGAPEKLLAWYTPIKTALLTLCGSAKENLSGFAANAVFIDAQARLDMCEALLETDALSWDSTALHELLARIDATKKMVDDSRDHLDESVATWLTDVLLDMRSVVETTLRAGGEAGREQMFTIIGRAHCRPCPQGKDELALNLIQRVADLSKRFGPLLYLGAEGVKLIAGGGG